MAKAEKRAREKDGTVRMEARVAFVREGHNIAEIAAAVDRSPVTVRGWMLEDGWEREREQYLLSSDGVTVLLEQQLRLRLLKIQEAGGLMTAADAQVALLISKAVKERRGDKASMVQVFSVVQDINLFLRGAAPEILPVLEPLVERFLHAQRKRALGPGA